MGVGLVIGSPTSFVGDSYVGAIDGALRESTGSFSFSGTVSTQRTAAKTASGEYTFDGITTAGWGKQSSGGFTLTGGIVTKQYTRTYGGTLSFISSALVTSQFSFGYRGSLGSIDFEGAALYNREFIPPDISGEFTLSGDVSYIKQLTKFARGQVVFDGSASVLRSKNYTTVSPLEFFGVLSSSGISSGSAVWYWDNAAKSLGSIIAGNSIWEGAPVDEPEDDYVPSSAWESGTVAGGVVVSGGRVW
jgi:hypothetical protein